jgi:DNA-binding NarL/FixJ family response regulator
MFNDSLINTLTITLNARELMVLNLIAEGLTNKEIGEKMFLSQRTIESNRLALMRKTNARNTAALIAYSFRQGILI